MVGEVPRQLIMWSEETLVGGSFGKGDPFSILSS